MEDWYASEPMTSRLSRKEKMREANFWLDAVETARVNEEYQRRHCPRSRKQGTASFYDWKTGLTEGVNLSDERVNALQRVDAFGVATSNKGSYRPTMST